MKSRTRFFIAAIGLLVVALVVEGWCPVNMIVNEAEARVGRPRTPNSVAGASRRTTRRVIRPSTTYVTVLPKSCTTVVIEGTSLHHCEGTYYQASKGQYVVVYVD